MKIKIHLVNGDIIERENIDKGAFSKYIKQVYGDYAALEVDNCLVLLKNIMYIEIEE